VEEKPARLESRYQKRELLLPEDGVKKYRAEKIKKKLKVPRNEDVAK